MRRTIKSIALACAMAALLGACSKNDAEYTELDRSWDSADSAFMADYDSVRTANERLEQEYQATAASNANDTMFAAQYAAAQQRLAANRQALQDMEARRVAARAARDSARTANDRAAYDRARATSDYNAWKAELNRIRAEQTSLQGTIKVGSKTVGSVDVNVKDSSKPLLRVEPGKNDDKPLIERNKNPK
jgi:chromosome segregation ATPase